jgi:hypothetical protein
MPSEVYSDTCRQVSPLEVLDNQQTLNSKMQHHKQEDTKATIARKNKHSEAAKEPCGGFQRDPCLIHNQHNKIQIHNDKNCTHLTLPSRRQTSSCTCKIGGVAKSGAAVESQPMFCYGQRPIGKCRSPQRKKPSDRDEQYKK